jgi:hypothetical protein
MSMSEKLVQMSKDLAEKGIDPEQLGIVMYGQEQVFGEILDVTPDAGRSVRVKNPKRFLRLQRVEPNNFRVEFILIDFDLMTVGVADIVPQVMFMLKNCDEETRVRYYGMYLGFFEQKKLASAARAGIVVAGAGDGVRSSLK